MKSRRETWELVAKLAERYDKYDNDVESLPTNTVDPTDIPRKRAQGSVEMGRCFDECDLVKLLGA
jgi:hypothetical protein